MPWYTSSKNSINIPKINKKILDTIVTGDENISEKIIELIEKAFKNKKSSVIFALDGYIGTNWRKILNLIQDIAKTKSLELKIINISSIFKSQEFIDNYCNQYLTDDEPSFGIVCEKGRIKDFINNEKLNKLKSDLKNLRKSNLIAVIIYGTGSVIRQTKDLYDLIFYFDVTRETIVKRLEDNEVILVGDTKPTPICWKKLYYVFYPVLMKHKNYVLKNMDFYIDNNIIGKQILINRNAYDTIVSTLATYPLKFKRVLMPGPWGGYFFRDYLNLPELSNCAWDIEVSGCDSSLLVDINKDIYFDLPLWNIYSKYPVEVVGTYFHKKYPGNYPIQVGIQDSYFPEPVPVERRNMPVHLHPDTKYIKNNFKESLGRYEVYYMCKTFKGSNMMHGFRKKADLEEFRQKIIESDKNKRKFDWDKYVKVWPTEVGCLYLVPAGTIHGTGGNQMVMEMDTGPSKQDTEYSFFIYDYCRNTWDDKTKTFTKKPSKLQVKHGLAQIRWFMRENWVKENLHVKLKVIRQGDGWSEEQFESYYPMPYHIERLKFKRNIETDTLGKFLHYLCLTQGERVQIESVSNPEIKIDIEYLQSTVIPACFGKYIIENLGKDKCEVIRQRWKRG